MDKYAFFLDIDGTLVGKGGIHPDNICAIKRAQKAGHFVFLNTGRGYASIAPEILNCAPFDGVVCGLGADIRVHGTQIFAKRMELSLLQKLTRVFLSLSDATGVFEGEDAMYSIGKTEGWVFCPLTTADDFTTKYKNAHISKFTCLPVDLSVFTPFLDELVLYDQKFYMELAQKGCSKAKGMHLAADFLGVPHCHCVAIGDSVNDMEMLQAAGIAVVMGNGSEQMKKIATFVTDTVDRAGVAQAIERIIGE